MTAVIVVAGWERFQHYKDRDPTWIKLYRDILTSESWVLGTDDSRLVQIASTLLAARYHNATPLNYSLFRKVASLDLSEAKFRAAIDHLAATGFLEIQGDTESRKHDASAPLAERSSEKRREEKRREEEKVPSEPVPQERDRDAISRVFDHWKVTHEHPKARLDDKRRRVIRAALLNYTADDLCESISGYLNSPHHMGQNDRATKFDDIELFLRDAKHIDAGLSFARGSVATVSKLTLKNVANTADWVPPEMRSAAN